AICSRLGGCTVSSTSLPASTAAGLSAHSTWEYRWSGNCAVTPAPRSSSTRAPAFTSLGAIWGTTLTRDSPGARSMSARMVTDILLPHGDGRSALWIDVQCRALLDLKMASRPSPSLLID